MNALSFGLLLSAGTVGADPLAPVAPYNPANPYVLTGQTDQAPPPSIPGAPGNAVVHPMYAATGIPQTTAMPAAPQPSLGDCCAAPARGLFESDRAFEGFIGPISNPVFSKDPRSNTYARFLFINNSFPGSHPFGGGTAQVYAMQVNVALTERLSFIADKDGIARISPRNGGGATGLLNLAAGFKYTFYRNVETQTLAAAGFMYEIPSGGANVFQNHGSGAIAPFITFGKEFNGKWHYLQTTGYYAPLHATQNTGFIYNSLHVDRQVQGSSASHLGMFGSYG